MAHGTPDWGVTAGARTTYQLTDLGELAARLGSPITHDRRGDVLWWDDFEWSLNKWTDNSSGTGGVAAISTVRARNGQASCLLTGGSDGTKQGWIDHYQAPVTQSRFGAEVSFSPAGTIDRFAVVLDIIRAGVRTFFIAQWDDVSDELQYTDAAGADAILATGVSLHKTSPTFHTLKVVGDLEAGEYVRIILNETEYSMAGVAAQQVGSATDENLHIGAHLFSRAGSNDTVYVDDAILTMNEPA